MQKLTLALCVDDQKMQKCTWAMGAEDQKYQKRTWTVGAQDQKGAKIRLGCDQTCKIALEPLVQMSTKLTNALWM